MYAILQTRFSRKVERDDPHLLFGIADSSAFYRKDGRLNDVNFHNIAEDLKHMTKDDLHDLNLSFVLILE